MRFSLYIAVFLLGLGVRAQENQLWLGYYSSLNLNSRFSINSDFQARTTQSQQQWSQVLGRTGLAFKVTQHISVTAGFADFIYFSQNKISRNEYRPWQEIAVQNQCGKYRVTHRIRSEQRYFRFAEHDVWTDHYSFNHRFRYKLEFQRPVWTPEDSEKRLDIFVANEIMFNAGDVKNYFDQNRSSAGLLYTLNKRLSVQLQYMFILQQGSGASTDRINTVRLNIYHTINL